MMLCLLQALVTLKHLSVSHATQKWIFIIIIPKEDLAGTGQRIFFGMIPTIELSGVFTDHNNIAPVSTKLGMGNIVR